MECSATKVRELTHTSTTFAALALKSKVLIHPVKKQRRKIVFTISKLDRSDIFASINYSVSLLDPAYYFYYDSNILLWII